MLNTARFFLLGWLGLLSSSALGQTYVNRVGSGGAIQDITVTQAVTWNSAGSPYIVEGHVTVAAGVTLRVEAGTVVKVNSGRGLYINGTLLAASASFTANGTEHWLGIYLAPSAGASTLEGCTIERAGASNLGYFHGAYRITAIYVDGCSPTVSNTVVSESAGQGIEVFDSAGTFRQNLFQNIANGAFGIMLDTINKFPTLAGNQAAGTGVPAIFLPGGAITGNNTWNNPGSGIFYYLGGEITIPQDAALTVDAGVVVKTTARRLVVNGTLSVNGTVQAPVLFTSSAAIPAAGDWLGIYFGATASASVINHTAIAYAGGNNLIYVHGAYRYTAVYLDGCDPVFDSVTVVNSASNGMEFYGSSAVVRNSTMDTCGGNAIKAEAGSRPVISQCTFLGNGRNEGGSYTIGTDASSVPAPAGNVFNNNRLQGVQIWGGTIPTNATWKVWNTNVPYVITADVSLPENNTLTVDPGATIKFQGAGLFIYGTLRADGVAGRISFTSWRDDTLAGDSNGDGAGAVAAPGDWRGIYLSPNSGNTVLNNCLLRYAGMGNLAYLHGAYRYVTVFIDGCSPTISNSTIQDSSANGLEFWSSQATVRDNQFVNFASGNYALVNDTLDTALLLSGNAFSGSGEPGIYIPAGSITGNVTWQKPGGDLVYFLNGELTVNEGVTLTVEPGVIVKTMGQRIVVYGTLKAQGTAAFPIVFTSRSATPAPGNWLGIYFAPTAGGSVLRYVNLTYGGANLVYTHGGYRYATLYFDGCSPVLDNVLVARSSNNGLELYGSQANVMNSVFRDCGGNGLRAEAGSRPSLDTVLFAGNGTNDPGAFAVALDASSVPLPQNVTFITNRWQGIQIWGGTLSASAQWRNWSPNAPYVVTDNVGVVADATLTIEPGATVKFAGRGLYLDGTLIANGTNAPITFTSSLDDTAGGDSNGDGSNSAAAQGNWTGIYLGSGSGSSVLNNCRLLFGGGSNLGYYHGGYRYTSLYVDSCSPAITGCTFADSAAHGAELWSSQALLQQNTFRNFGSADSPGYPIVFDTLDRFPVLVGNSVAGTGLSGIYVPSGVISQSGTWNQPGENFPYLLNGDLTIAEAISFHLEPGVEVRADNAGIYVNGSLTAAGSPQLPILLTSRRSNKNPGDWKGLYFGPSSATSMVDFVTIKYAGQNLAYLHGAYRYTSVYVDSSSPQLDNLIVSHGSANGIEMFNSGSTVQSSLIFSNQGHGLLLYGDTQPLLLNNTIVTNGLSGIYSVDSSPTVANNLVVWNSNNGIRRDAGTLTLVNNCVFGNALANYFNSVPGTFDISLDPNFVGFAVEDFHLAANSPAVDAGSNAMLSPGWVDLDGHARLSGSRIDMGAYETGSSGVVVPVITSSLSAAGTVGVPFTYQILAANNPTNYAAIGLPAGLNLDRATGLISGIPLNVGTNTVLLSAQNPAGGGSATLTVAISIPSTVPVITGEVTATGQAGASFSYQIVASNNPTNYNATSLPPGLQVNPATGLISGIPLAGGTNLVELIAENASGRGSRVLTLIIIAHVSEVLFDNGNIYAVQNGPTSPTTITLDKAIVLTYIRDYHYFNHGVLPGTISLRHEDGTVYGPWQTTGLAGQGGVANASWVAEPNVELKAGKYTVIDSDPSTWSHNSSSGFAGFTYIKGYVLSSAGPELHISVTVFGTISLQWVSNDQWILEEAGSVSEPNWTDVTDMAVQSGNQFTITLSSGSPMRFYRLRTP